jgi:hypothetical protein
MNYPAVINQTLRWGLSEAGEVHFGSSSVYQCFPVKAPHHFVITQKYCALVSTSAVLQRSTVSVLCGVYVPECEVVVGPSSVLNKFILFRIYDLANPVYPSEPMPQLGVMHILCSPRSRFLVTVADDV